MGDNPQWVEDKYFIQNIITNRCQVVDNAHPERQTEVINILRRLSDNGRRRGSITKVNLVELTEFLPGQPALQPTLPKSDMVGVLLEVLQPPNGPPPVVTEPVESWEQFFGETPTVGQATGGEVHSSPSR